jgi:flagellar motility protein MotE (MotC chaperone)
MTVFKSRSRYLRLLPGVMLVCGGLMVLKASGIVHDALAEEGPPTAADAMAPAPKPANQDFAGGDAQAGSAAAVDVLTSLSKRRTILDAREAEVQTESNVLAATESRVDTKIAQLKTLQSQIAALLVQRDAEQQKQIAVLVKTYGPDGMKAANAAAIFSTLPDDVLIPVAQGMKPADLGAILSKMSPEAAQKLTLKLASKLALPDTAAALAPVAPVTTAAAGPVPAPAAKPATPAPVAAPTQAAAPTTAKPKS